MKTLRFRRFVLRALLGGLGVMLAGRAPAQTFKVLHTFAYNDGAGPDASVLLSSNTLYGTTYQGGTNASGTVFKINTDGTGYTNLHTFTAASDGQNPGQVILASNLLYGTTGNGTANGSGSVFKINTNGAGFTNIYKFTALSGSPGTNGDGARPDGALTISNNTLYGTALLGGAHGNGTVFKVNTDGNGFTNLHSFGAGTGSFPFVANNEGAFPNSALLLYNNMLYGTTRSGGPNSDGVLFRINPDGTGFTNLYSFTGGSDGSQPGGLLLQSGGTLYGAAFAGGDNGYGTLFAIGADGNGFTNLYTFSEGVGTLPSVINSDGAGPSVVILTNNTLYGKAAFGTSSGAGTVFMLNVDGSGFTNLYDFTALSVPFTGTNKDGADPGYLILSGNLLYGSADEGGTNGYGTLFTLSLPVAGPSIGIATAGNKIVLSWPTNATGYALQYLGNLSSGNWSNVTSGITTMGADYVFTNTVAGNASFFRLKQ